MSSEVKSLKTEKPRILGSQKIIADDLQFNEFKKAFHEELEIKYCYQGGFGVLVGITGGFLWGFLFSAILCGVSKNIKHKATKYGLMTLAVLLCHAAGVTQFCIITGNGVWAAFLTVSLPFLLKDLILVFLAEIVSKKIKIL